jgi:formate dehydrogenase
MTILNGVRNFVPGKSLRNLKRHIRQLTVLLYRNKAHEQVMAGGWDVAAVARNAFDLEGKVVGTLACGRIGYRVLQRLKAFDCKVSPALFSDGRFDSQ